MDPNEPVDLEKELSRRPIHGKGFDENLKQRIEKQLEHHEERRRRWLRPLLGLCGGLAMLWGFVLALPYLTDTGKGVEVSQAVQGAEAVQPSTIAIAPPATPVIKTALLIGFRTDYEREDSGRALGPISYSTYRTLLIAPVGSSLSVAAEGSGILMPYGTKFWKIDAVNVETETDVHQYLAPHLADRAAEPFLMPDDPEEELRHSEKLLFAGNQYLSVAESETVWRGNAPADFNRIWVRKLPQLGLNRVVSFADRKADEDTEHISLQEVFGAGINSALSELSRQPKVDGWASEITGESWTITRQPGHWVAQAAETFEGMSKLEGYELHHLPEMLPEAVTSYDRVCCSWNAVRTLQPDAKDMLSSPLDDMLAVLTDHRLVVFAPVPLSSTAVPVRQDPLLTVELQPGEKLVMAQWATGGYVKDWIEKARKYLK